MKSHLVVASGSAEGKQIPITKASFVIGREPGCHLRPASQTISKRHCAIHRRGDGLVLEDLGSTNGTYLNDVRCEGTQPLQDGDRVKVGPLEFVVRFDGVVADKPTQADRETDVESPQPAPTPVPAAKAKPKPAAKPAPAAKEPELFDEDAIASMLLEGGHETPAPAGDSDPSGGSTVMEVLTPAQMEQLAQSGSGTAAPYRPPSGKPATSASSSQAAKNILEKYRRRPKA